MDIMRHYHGTRHLGVDKVYNACARGSFWPKMCDEIATSIARCYDCQINKVRIQAPEELLQSLDVPERSWDDVTTDCLTKLPSSASGLDVILVIVD